MDENGTKRKVTELKNLVEKIHGLLPLARRPLIIEFSGTPKAGKTVAAGRLELYLRRNNFSVQLFTERASIAPMRMKGHLFFNVWVSCASLMGILEALQTDLDILIIDRGIFDACCWNKWLEVTGKISKDEGDIVKQFFLLERWRSLVDIVFLMTTTPEMAIKREYTDLLIDKDDKIAFGEIMNPTTLGQFNRATEIISEELRDEFKHIVKIDTTNKPTSEGVEEITTMTLKTLHTFLDQKVLVIEEGILNIKKNGFYSNLSELDAVIKKIIQNAKFVPHSEANQSRRYIQIIPCGIIRFENKLCIFRRKEEGHPLHDTYAIWAGGHVKEEDKHNGNNIVENALKRELSEELYITKEYQTFPFGYIHTGVDFRASRHLGIVYQIRLGSPEVALAMDQHEFKEPRGRSVSGKLLELAEIKKYYNEMGAWSKFLYRHLSGEEEPSLFSGL